MGARRPRALPALLLLVLSGLFLVSCGGGGPSGSLSLSQLPLVPGASVLTQVRQCDKGSDAFCTIEAVIVDKQAHSSGSLVASEHRQLHSLGWTTSAGDDGVQVAADSPGHKLRLTYATALGDLFGLDMDWLKQPRPRAIGLSLAQTMFDRTPAMSIMLEAGPT